MASAMASRPEALDQKAAEQLNVDLIPGTEIMSDVGDVHFAHAGGAANGSVYVDTYRCDFERVIIDGVSG